MSIFQIGKLYRYRRLERQYLRGYDWAAGALLRGAQSIEEVDARIYWCDPFPSTEHSRMFDRGAGDALAQFKILSKI